MKRNVYIAFTPYHIFLASMIALEYEQDDNQLIIVADFAAEKIAAAVQGSSLFSKCCVLPGLYKLEKHRNARRKENAAAMRRWLALGAAADRIFLGTDTRLESQAAAFHAKKRNGQSRIVVLEDGGDFYSSVDEGYRPKSAWRQWVNKLHFGRWYEDVKIAGLYTASEEIRMIYPSLARHELQDKLRTPIHARYCFTEAYRKFLEIYWRSFAEVKQKIAAVDGILMITYSGYTRNFPDYIPFIQEFCRTSMCAGKKIAVKYHPREEKPDYCRLGGGVLFLPEEIPAEVLYASSGRDLKWVVGDVSSALMTAKWLLGRQVCVYSIAPVLKMNDAALVHVFHEIGVRLIEDFAELKF